MTPEINAEIAERIMGWQVNRLRGAYQPPEQQPGVLEPLPDFRGKDHERLLEIMRDRGYDLTVTEAPPNIQSKKEKTFTACYSRRGVKYDATKSDKQEAVCMAALKAHNYREWLLNLKED